MKKVISQTHTPGPLTVYCEKKLSWRNMTPSYQIVGPSKSGMTSRTVYGGAFAQENATLWSAAPDLLLALKLMTGDRPTNDDYEIASAAIAKAEGR